MKKTLKILMYCKPQQTILAVRELISSFPEIKLLENEIDNYDVKEIQVKKIALILMNAEDDMPEYSNFLKNKAKNSVNIPVILLTSGISKNAGKLYKLLKKGASDFLIVPKSKETQGNNSLKKIFINTLLLYANDFTQKNDKKPDKHEDDKMSPVIRKWNLMKKGKITSERVMPKRLPGNINIIAIEMSFSSYSILHNVLEGLDPLLKSSVIISHNIPAFFIPTLIKDLNKLCPLNVIIPGDKEKVLPGKVYLNPGGKNIYLESKKYKNILRISPGINGNEPVSAGKILFSSIAEIFRNKCLAIVMSGADSGSVEGIKNVFFEGGLTMAQDCKTSVDFKMQKIAIEKGIVHLVIPLYKIVETINYLTRMYS